MTVEGIVMQSESKLRQLAVDLKLMINGDKITMDALKGKVISHVIEQNLCKPSWRGGHAGSTTETERNVAGNTDRRGMGDAAMDGEFVQQMTELKDMITQLGKNMGEKQSSLELSLSNMQQSLTSLSGFIADFKGKLNEVEKLATERWAEIEELGREVRGLKDARTKQAEAIQELREQCKEGQVNHVSLLALLVACESDTTERSSLPRPPPPPPAVSSVWCKRVESLAVAEAAQDRPNQERVLLDLRITGPLLDAEMVPEPELQAQVTESLGKAIGIEGNELGITGVRLHRVRTTRGARASTGTAAPICPPPQIIVTCTSLAAKK
jgi:archaellum component FlaC